MKAELLSFGSPLELAKAAAEAWVSSLAARRQSSHLVALSGGRIARQFFTAIVESANKTVPLLQQVHFFWADERCVPAKDPESNFTVADELLLRPLAVAPNQIHRIRGEIAPEEAARQAADDLRRFARNHSNTQPVLDQIFLGMGEDGHVASLFPDLPSQLIDSPEVYFPVTATKPPPRRITLSYATISAAREVWVLVSGPGKTQALQDSLRPTSQTPLGRVMRMRQGTKIFSDVSPSIPTT